MSQISSSQEMGPAEGRAAAASRRVPPPGPITALAPAETLLSRLVGRGWQFDFFQAVWLLEQHLKDAEPVGQRGPVANEALRFRPAVSLGFPATDVRRITKEKVPRSAELESRGRKEYFQIEETFLGLYGVATPLPLHYAIRILRAEAAEGGNPASEAAAVGGTQVPASNLQAAPPGSETAPVATNPMRDFLDLIHHRIVSLFYRAWVKYRYHVAFALPQRDRLTDYLLWLIGCQPGWGQDLLGLEPLRLLRYADALTARPRSAARLRGLLTDYWKDVPVEIEQVVGRWVPLRGADLARLGMMNSRLGVDLTVGEQVFDLNGAFRIRLGPVGWQEYLEFLPGAERFLQTRKLVKLYCNDPLAFSFELRLKAGEAPPLELSSSGGAARLGYTSWARTAELPETSVCFDAA